MLVNTIFESAEDQIIDVAKAFAVALERAGIDYRVVGGLVRMKLTSFRLKDRVHIQDLDAVALVTPDIEAGLSELLRERLAQVRATE